MMMTSLSPMTQVIQTLPPSLPRMIGVQPLDHPRAPCPVWTRTRMRPRRSQKRPLRSPPGSHRLQTLPPRTPRRSLPPQRGARRTRSWRRRTLKSPLVSSKISKTRTGFVLGSRGMIRGPSSYRNHLGRDSLHSKNRWGNPDLIIRYRTHQGSPVLGNQTEPL